MHHMRALVTGGCGFIGSHLCERLLKEGFDVITLDNLQTGYLENVAHLDKKHFQFKRHDVVKPYNIKAERIYNFACPASPVQYKKNSLRTLRTSLWGTDHACMNAVSYHARMLQASTSEIYGDPSISPQPESYWGNVNCVGPRACYDEGKRAAETLCVDYAKEQQMQLRLIRIFNTYGPRMDRDDGRVVSNFIMQALLGKTLTIYGDGQQTRSFCFVSDLVEGIFRMMEQEREQGPLNLGNPTEFTILQLAEVVLRLTGSKSKVEIIPQPADGVYALSVDPRQRKPDIAKAKAALGGWEPKVSLEEGLKETIAYFKARIK